MLRLRLLILPSSVYRRVAKELVVDVEYRSAYQGARYSLFCGHEIVYWEALGEREYPHRKIGFISGGDGAWTARCCD